MSSGIVKFTLKLLTYKEKITAIYTRIEGKTSETEEFYGELRAAYDKINRTDYLILASDFNSTVR
jgi:hypothetical protein